MRLILSDLSFQRVVVLIISLLGVFTLFLRHKSKAKWLNEDLPNEMTQNLYTNNVLDWEQDYSTGLMFKRRKWFKTSFWIEALFLLACPIPYWDKAFSMSVLDVGTKQEKVQVYYLVSDLILVVMFVRMFFIVRAVFNYNLYTDQYSTKLCKSFGFSANIRFAYKCLMKENPL